MYNLEIVWAQATHVIPFNVELSSNGEQSPLLW